MVLWSLFILELIWCGEGDVLDIVQVVGFIFDGVVFRVKFLNDSIVFGFQGFVQFVMVFEVEVLYYDGGIKSDFI